jgi:hypothetical protein
MLFDVLKVRDRGEYSLILLRTNQNSLKSILNFLETASEFINIFQYRHNAEIKAIQKERERKESEESERKFRQNILELYRTLKGSPSARINQIQGILKLQGECRSLTYSEVEAYINIAREDERKAS